MNVLETHRLGKRYHRNWALRDCTLAIPPGRIVALAGPNGAGKTTLLHLAVGLLNPTEGGITALGGAPGASSATRSRIGFVAQTAPLYANLSVADTLHFARNLNSRWDQSYAESRANWRYLPEKGSDGFRAVSRLKWLSPSPWPSGLISSSWMSRWRAWIRSRGMSSWLPS